MKKLPILFPVAATFIALSPFAADAASRSPTSQSAIYAAGVGSGHVAANSKRRPGEFQPRVQEADDQYGFSSGPTPNKDGAPIPNGD